MIPKKIHFCWLSEDPYPEMIKSCIDSWHENLPDYEFIIWDRNKINIEDIPWVKEAYENKKYAFAADYIRLFALYTEGGIYLDSDVQILKNVSPLLNCGSFIGFEYSDDFEAALIGAEAGTRWIGKCLDYYKNRHFIMPDGSFEDLPLPVIIGKILRKKYSIPDYLNNVYVVQDADLMIYPYTYFSPKSLYKKKIKIYPETYAIHHFDGGWIKKDHNYKMKNFIHKVVLFSFGKRMHNFLIKKMFRK